MRKYGKKCKALIENCQNVYGLDKYDQADQSRSILCVVPDLSLNGAQTVFCELLSLMRTIGEYRFCIISPEDGEYRNKYVNEGSMVCIRPLVVADDDVRYDLQHQFDAVILNTALVHGYAMFFINTDVPLLWWIHEGEEHIRACCMDMPNPNLLSSNIHIFSVSYRVQNALRSVFQFNSEIMNMFIEDERDKYISGDIEHERVVFVIPGAYIPLKGQDIMLSAIAELPEEYRDKASFVFCGYKVVGNEEYHDRIIEISSRYDCIRHIGQLSKNELYKLYAECDCVVAPSRTDSNPATIVEAMMFGKISIASVNCGVSLFIKDCINGFVFDGVNELVKRLLLVINDIDSIRCIGERGRQIYLEHYSSKTVIGMLKEIL